MCIHCGFSLVTSAIVFGVAVQASLHRAECTYGCGQCVRAGRSAALFLLSGIVFVVGVVEVGDLHLRLLLPATSHSNAQMLRNVRQSSIFGYFHLPSVCVCLSLSAKSSFTFHHCGHCH